MCVRRCERTTGDEPKAGGVYPKPANLDGTARAVVACGTRHTRRGVIRVQEAVVACKLLEADGQEEGERHDDKDFAVGVVGRECRNRE